MEYAGTAALVSVQQPPGRTDKIVNYPGRHYIFVTTQMGGGGGRGKTTLAKKAVFSLYWRRIGPAIPLLAQLLLRH